MSLRIFISHAKEDRIKALSLYDDLKGARFEPWIDEYDLLPGQRWEVVIPQVIAESDIFVACLSRASVKKRGYVQAELQFAYSEDRKVPEHLVYIVPLRFDDCGVPFELRKYSWVDYFNEEDAIRFVKKLQAYRQQSDPQTPPITPADIVEAYKTRFEAMNSAKLRAQLGEELRLDEQNPAYCLLYSIARLRGADLSAHGLSTHEVKEIERDLEWARRDSILCSTALYAMALIKYDYYESRYWHAAPSSAELLAEIQRQGIKPDRFLAGQLRSSRQFAYKSKTLWL
jgi:hypothetical protein